MDTRHYENLVFPPQFIYIKWTPIWLGRVKPKQLTKTKVDLPVEVPCFTWISKCMLQHSLQKVWPHVRRATFSGVLIRTHTGQIMVSSLSPPGSLAVVDWGGVVGLICTDASNRWQSWRYPSTISTWSQLYICSRSFASEGVTYDEERCVKLPPTAVQWLYWKDHCIPNNKY